MEELSGIKDREDFTFEFRERNKFPLFKCEKCSVECIADFNAAKNIANMTL